MEKKKGRINFNQKELEEILKAFYTVTKTRIVVFDDNFEKLAAYPERHLRYCTILREDEAAKEACKQCDLEGCRKCKAKRETYSYECHAGLREVVLPLMDGAVIIGYLMLGETILDDGKEKEEKWNELCGRLKNFSIDFDALKECFWNSVRVKEEFLISSAKIMESCASYLYLKRIIKQQEKTLAKQIEEYISSHIKEEITVEGICEEFGVGRTKLYQIAEHSFGKGLAKEIREMRIRQAERLLLETDMKISEVAAETGYADYNYFTKIFKKECGMTPRDYRKRLGGGVKPAFSINAKKSFYSRCQFAVKALFITKIYCEIDTKKYSFLHENRKNE